MAERRVRRCGYLFYCIVHLIEKILIYDGKRIEVCFRYKDELENALQYIERFENVLPAEEGVTMLERRNA